MSHSARHNTPIYIKIYRRRKVNFFLLLWCGAKQPISSSSPIPTNHHHFITRVVMFRGSQGQGGNFSWLCPVRPKPELLHFSTFIVLLRPRDSTKRFEWTLTNTFCLNIERNKKTKMNSADHRAGDLMWAILHVLFWNWSWKQCSVHNVLILVVVSHWGVPVSVES